MDNENKKVEETVEVKADARHPDKRVKLVAWFAIALVAIVAVCTMGNIMKQKAALDAQAQAPAVASSVVMQVESVTESAPASESAAVSESATERAVFSAQEEDAFGRFSQVESHALAIQKYPITTQTAKTASAYPAYGTRVGTLESAEMGFSVSLYWSMDQSVVDRTSSAAVLSYSGGIGDQSRMAVIADHKNQAFASLEYAKPGMYLYAKTNYGEFLYRVEYTATGYTYGYYPDLYFADGSSVFTMANHGTYPGGLILYTCYPFHGPTTGRYYVVCSLVKGTTLN